VTTCLGFERNEVKKENIISNSREKYLFSSEEQRLKKR
jgi:hypothetical protein